MPETLTWSPTAVIPEPPPATAFAAEIPVHDALPPGTRLDEFEIIRVLGAGGFGIVYLALDHVLLRYVAIKEYMPTALAGRGAASTVAVRSPGHAETYAAGLESFFNEARMLASFDHPSLVKVHRFWKAHGTSYMAMQYYPGRTLRDARAELPGPPDEAWIRACIEPILGALEALHAEDVYHRDIAPDNILLLPDGRPVLLDFGSARQVIGDRTQSITAVLKPNFAPIEQYADEPGMRQGPWTDVYALGATMYFMLTGQAPTPAVLRAVRDTLRVLADPSSGPFPGVSQALLATVDWTLALAPEDRPQSVATLRRGLGGDLRAPAPTPRFAAVGRDEPEPEPPAATLVLPRPTAVDLPITSAPVAAAPPMPATSPVAPPPPPAAAAQEESPPDLRPRGRTDVPRPPMPRGLMVLCGGIAVFVLAVFGAGRWLSTSSASPAAAEPAAASAALSALSALSAAAPAPAPAVPVEGPSASPAADPAPPSPPPALDTATVSAQATAGPPPSASGPAGRREAARPLPAARHEARTFRPLPAPASEVEPVRPVAAAPAEKIAVAAPARSPKDLCGEMNFVALALCVSRQCQSPALQSHPQCVESRRYDDQRRRRMEQ